MRYFDNDYPQGVCHTARKMETRSRGATVVAEPSWSRSAAADGTASLLERVVALLLQHVQPRRIILFGSYARGEATPESDLDLIVIEDEVADRFAEMVRLRRALASIRMPIDVLVYSERDVQERGQWIGTPLAEGLREGRVLYAAE